MHHTAQSAAVERPRVVLVTGAPGSGKTTLATQLARELRVPFLARDDVRGGLLMTAGGWTDEVRRIPPADEAVDVFLHLAESMLRAGVSCVLEYVVRNGRPADFQRLTALADVVVIETFCDDPMRRVRDRNNADRLIANSAVLEATGFDSVTQHTAAVVERMTSVASEMRTTFEVPMMRVETNDGAEPPLDELVDFVTP